MLTIHKYELELTDVQTVAMPRVHRMLSVIEQRGKIVLYALVHPNDQPVHREVLIIGTGHPIPAPVKHEFIGTVPMNDGKLVFHVFYDRQYFQLE